MLAELGDLGVKIKELLEAFGTQRVRDPSGTDYEKDPETGEYTGRTEVDPRSFTNMLTGVADRLSADSGSRWIKAPDAAQKPKAVSRTDVPEGKMLVVTTKNGRKFFKYPATDKSNDQSGFWTDENGTEINNPNTINTLEKLAKWYGKLVVNPQAVRAAQQAAQQAAQPEQPEEPVGEPSTSEPLHPDVSIVQSVPLVIQYKGKRFEMDDYGDFHPFGTTRAVTPALQTFLTKERSKL